MGEKEKFVKEFENTKKNTEKSFTYTKVFNTNGSNFLLSLPTSAIAIKNRFEYSKDFHRGELVTKTNKKAILEDYEASRNLGQSLLFFLYCLEHYTAKVPSKSDKKSYNKYIERFQNRNSSIDTRSVDIEFDKYLQDFGIENTDNNRKNERRNIKKYVQTLKNLSLTYDDISFETHKLKTYSVGILSGKSEECYKPKTNGDFSIIFDYDFVNYLIDRDYIMGLPSNTYKLDVYRHPNCLAIIIKLLSNYFINKETHKSRKNYIVASTLIENVLNLPAVEDVQKTSHSPTNRIIKKLEEDLDYLNDEGLIKWHWIRNDETPLSDKQVTLQTYDTLINQKIWYELLNLPEEFTS